MEYDYPLLKKVLGHYGKASITDVTLVCCQHLLEPQLEMFKHFIEFGILPENIVVLGKAYSANGEVAKEIEDLGIRVALPKFLGGPFDDEHISNCKSLLEFVPKTSQAVLLDDGGELIKVFAESKQKVLFAVEQTSSGFRKIQKLPLKFPVVNVARSVIKLTQESPIIARLCFERIQNYIEEKKLGTPSILIVGLGPIGESIRQILTEHYIVHEFEIAKGHSDLTGYLIKNQPSIVIGATGSPILNSENIDKLFSKHQFHLISVSSSDREFPVPKYRADSRVHVDITYKNITFVNNGFPITFKGNRYESTPAEIEKTIALLESSIMHGLSGGYGSAYGLIDVPEEIAAVLNS